MPLMVHSYLNTNSDKQRERKLANAMLSNERINVQLNEWMSEQMNEWMLQRRSNHPKESVAVK